MEEGRWRKEGGGRGQRTFHVISRGCFGGDRTFLAFGMRKGRREGMRTKGYERRNKTQGLRNRNKKIRKEEYDTGNKTGNKKRGIRNEE